MKKINLTGVVLGALAAALVAAPTASAIAPMGGSAEDTVRWLEQEGYHVQMNGKPYGELSGCTATRVHGMRDSNVDENGRIIDSDQFTTVHVDVSCNNTV